MSYITERDRELRQNLALDEDCTARHSVCVHITLLGHVTLYVQWQVTCVEFYHHHPHMYLEHGDLFYLDSIAPLNYTASHEATTYRTVKDPAGSQTLNIHLKFYIRCSVCRNSRLKKSNKMQQYADVYLLLNYCTCFGRPSRSSSVVHKTVVAASGTDRTVWGASFFKRGRANFLKCGHVWGSLLSR